jgi:hypothetical protein
MSVQSTTGNAIRRSDVGRHRSPRLLLCLALAGGLLMWVLVSGRPLTSTFIASSQILLPAMLVYMALLALYPDHPFDAYARIRQVSISCRGWLAAEAEHTYWSPVALLLDQFQRTAPLPFKTIPKTNFYSPRAWLAGPLAALTALGLVLATRRVLQREYFGSVVASWAPVVGLTSFTRDGARG